MRTLPHLLPLLAALLAAAQAQQQTGGDVVITMPITIDGALKDLQLLRGESFEDAATSFARDNGLLAATDDARVRAVIDQLSGLLKDKMQEVEASGNAQTAAPARPAEPVPSVQLTMPLTVDGYTGNLLKYVGETPEAAVERFLYASGFTMDVMRELYPQLVSLVNRKLAELQPPRRELFAFALSLDGRELTVRHFEGGVPLEEAVATLRGIGVGDGELMDRVAPQIANEISKRIDSEAAVANAQAQAQAQAEAEAAQQAAQQQQQQERAPPRELFSMPLTLNDEPAIMVHYDGATAKDTAVRFLHDNGVSDDETVESLVPQLVEMVDSRMAELLQEEAQARAQAQAQAQAQAAELQQEQEQQAQAPRQPLVTLPINLGDNKQASLEYFAGDSVERTVELFLVAVGLGDGELFHDNVAQLASLLRGNLAALEQQQQQQQMQQQAQAQAAQATQPRPLFSFPVTLSGTVFDLEYFAGQEPAYTANTFCVEKHELVRAELGVQFDGDQLVECQNVLAQSIRNLLDEGRAKDAQGAQQQQQGEAAAAPAPVQPPLDPRGQLLFTMDIDMGDGTSLKLPFHRNDAPRELAAAFCAEHNLDLDNVPALVDAMEAQLADL